MGYRLYPLLISAVIVLIGHTVKRVWIQRYKNRTVETIEFSNKFVALANNYMQHYRIDQNLYSACIHDVDKIQSELGNDGIVAEFIDSLKGLKYHNYQLFVNVLPEMRTMVGQMDNSIIIGRMNQLICMCDDAIQRHIGNLDRAVNNEKSGIYNPFSCFGSGIRWIVGLPFDILCWCGIMSSSHNNGVHSNVLFKFISNLIVLIGLLSSIVTIALGWDGFCRMIQNLILGK